MKTTKNRLIRKKNIPKDELLYTVKIRTIELYGWIGIVSIVLLLFKVYMVGIAFFSVFFMLMLFVNDQVLCEVYPRFIVSYLEDDAEKVLLIYYKDIVNWRLENKHQIAIMTTDGAEYHIDIVRAAKVLESLESLIGNKKV